ncbi:flavin reductase [Candidatus Epulonipiscium fishelsonii]|uniref:Flavin reductase n=1 Tax=Candidatus Epulonipiscium fishelsonii TaxID=77094 RepID=A0ACC8XAA7_9FIRM|nr:flavin reductase [Epulopiscium sp. SCG-B11WGA-EpuloA1]
MQEVMYNKYANQVLEGIQKGAFLSVSTDIDNIMTISWGNLGFMWRRPIITIMIRYSRFTYEMLEKSKQFTLSIPLTDTLKKELTICGTTSGRNSDKWETTGLTKVKAHKVNSPLVGECDIHFECKVIGTLPMTEGMLNMDINEQFYNKGDYHVFYYGEILGTYIKEEKE